MADPIVCPQCGSSINPNTRFCPECGYPVQAEFYQSQPGRPAPVQPTQKMDDVPDFSPYPPAAAPEPEYYSEPEKPRSRRMLYVLGGGAALLLCCALAGVLLIFSALGDGEFSISLFATDTPTPTATATHTPTPTVTPTTPPTNTPLPLPPTQPPADPTTGPSGPALTGSQRLTDTDFFDDFSSDALEWWVDTTENTQVGYESEAYFIEIYQSGYLQVVPPPIEDLTHLEFNAEIVSGYGNGAVGFACYYTDVDNFTYVIFDPEQQNLIFAQFINGEFSQLTDWFDHTQPTSGARYGADCTANSMVAYVNNVPVGNISISKPSGPFKMWVYAITFSDAAGGMKVLFDNVSGFSAQP